MRQLERVLHSERTGTGIFATVLSLEIAADSPRVTAIRAGHPGMLLQDGGTVDWIEPPAGPALGLHADDWPRHELELPAGDGLLLLTDGLFEGYSGRATNASARTACSRWRVRTRIVPVRRSSTR